MAEPKPEEIEMLVNMSALHPSEAIKLLKVKAHGSMVAVESLLKEREGPQQ